VFASCMLGMVSFELGQFALEFRGMLLEPGTNRIPELDPLACRLVVCPGLAVVSLRDVAVLAWVAHGSGRPVRR
jgi:hypothetical protein